MLDEMRLQMAYEATNGMSQLNDFVRGNSNTNIIQICVPHRFDIHVNSCVKKKDEIFQ
jgi:hypothetical protein